MLEEKTELMRDEGFIEFMRRYYPVYSNAMLVKMIKEEYNIELDIRELEKIIYKIRKENPDIVRRKYPVLLRKYILKKNGLPKDDRARTPSMGGMRLSKYLIITKCENIINSIKNRENIKSIKDLKDKKVFITHKDMGGRQSTVIKYLSDRGILESWGGRRYICDVRKLVMLVEELKKLKSPVVVVYNNGNGNNGNGGKNGENKRYREVAREN